MYVHVYLVVITFVLFFVWYYFFGITFTEKTACSFCSLYKKSTNASFNLFTTVTFQSLNVHIWPQKIYQLIPKSLCLDNKNSIKNTKQDAKWVRLWSGHSMYGQHCPCCSGTLCCMSLHPLSSQFPFIFWSVKIKAKANQIKEFHSRGWSYSTFVHRGRQSKAKRSTATSNTTNHAFINICHLCRSVSRLSCEFLDWSVLLSPPDAYRSPHWISAGWCSRCEDATLLPFREQCHISQQVWIMQPAWKNQHQPYNLQVR